MASRTPNSELRTPNLNRLVPALLDWFSTNARDLPWRRTRDPYAVWVSEIMLQQTQVKTVLLYWKRWMRKLPNVRAATNASPEKIHKLWEGLGYYTRVRNLQKAAQQIVEKHDGKFPNNFDDVVALPGVGRYTAGAICSIAFNQPTPILDGNVIRVLTRIFGIEKNPREKETNRLLWQIAEELVKVAQASCLRGQTGSLPYFNRACSKLNQSLMELGALVCTPRNPQCPVCPVKKLCVAFRENHVAELPNLGRRTATTARRFIAFVIERNGKFLVRQRPAGVVNAHLWEFPNIEIMPSQSSSPAVRDKSAHYFRRIYQSRLTSAATDQGFDLDVVCAAKKLRVKPSALQPLCTVKHSITRYRITLEAFYIHLRGRNSVKPQKSGHRKTPPPETGVWLTPAQLRPLAFASAHKKLASTATNRILSDR